MQFLRHLQRTKLLLHMVDISATADAYGNEKVGVGLLPIEQVRKLEIELERHDPALLDKPRWLVLNKADLMPQEEAQALAEALIAELRWTAPWYLVSAVEP